MNNQNTIKPGMNSEIIAQWMLVIHRSFINKFLNHNTTKKEILPPGSAPIYTHSLEYIEQYKNNLKNKKMESNTIKMNYYDKVNGCRESMSDDWFSFILTMIMDVVSDSELSKEDTIELIGFLNEELSK